MKEQETQQLMINECARSKERQCVYNVTVRRVRVTTVAVEKATSIAY
jgi:hypothetical protein